MITFFVCILCGAAAGLGVFIVFLAIRDGKVKTKTKVANRQANLNRSLNIIIAPTVGVVIFLVTRWLLVAVVLSLVVIAVPALKSKQRLRRDERGLADAIATWTEQLRDTLAGAHGLEQAIVATSEHAPLAISVAVRRLSAQIQYGKLSDGLRRFADEVDHPIADFRPPCSMRPRRRADENSHLGRASENPKFSAHYFFCCYRLYRIASYFQSGLFERLLVT